MLGTESNVALPHFREADLGLFGRGGAESPLGTCKATIQVLPQELAGMATFQERGMPCAGHGIWGSLSFPSCHPHISHAESREAQVALRKGSLPAGGGLGRGVFRSIVL